MLENKSMKRNIFLLCFSVLVSFQISSLELSGGKIKCELIKSTGRFSLYYLDDISKRTYIPLIFAKDPETTSIFLSLNNNIYTPGDSSYFSQKIVRNNEYSGSFIWTSKLIRVTENFTLIKSVSSTLYDGIKITITLTGLSESTNKVGLSYLFDTYLGEKSRIHFITDSGTVINSETRYSNSYPLYFLSPVEKKSFKGLQCMLRGPGISVPDTVIFANWKRLKENIWEYKPQISRNFNFLPYSINDSAFALYYDQQLLQKNKNRSISIVLGAGTGSTFQGESQSSDKSDVNNLYIQTIKTRNSGASVEASIKTDLMYVDDLLKKIERNIQYPDQINKKNLDLMQEVINNLKHHKSLYEKR